MSEHPQPVDLDERRQRTEMLRALGFDPRNPMHRAAVAIADRLGLDPLLRHVVVIPRGGVYLTRDGLLAIAHRSGQLDGIVVEDQGEDDTHHWAVVSVWRKDMAHPFRYRGRYPRDGANRQFGPEMAVKCAEVAALRRAFDVSGLPTVEERWDETSDGEAQGPRD